MALRAGTTLFWATFALSCSTLKDPVPASTTDDTDSGATTGADAATAMTCQTADLQTSAAHCGRCGHSCLGGECRDGACTPVTLAADRFSPSDLGLLGDYLYVIEQGNGAANGQLSRVLAASCAPPEPCAKPEVLVPNLVAPSGITFSAKDVFITRGTFSSGQVLRYVVGSTSGARVFANSEIFPTRAVFTQISNGSVLWLQSGANGALRSKMEDEMFPASSLLSGRPNPGDIALRGNVTCWSESGDPGLDKDGRVWCLDLRTTPLTPVSIATGQPGPRGLALDGTYVYWTNRGNGTIQKRRIDASTAIQELHSGLDNPASISVSGDLLVWVENGVDPDFRNGRVRASDKEGKNARTLVASEPFPTRLVTDAVSAYYIRKGSIGKEYKDGEVKRIAF